MLLFTFIPSTPCGAFDLESVLKYSVWHQKYKRQEQFTICFTINCIVLDEYQRNYTLLESCRLVPEVQVQVILCYLPVFQTLEYLSHNQDEMMLYAFLNLVSPQKNYKGRISISIFISGLSFLSSNWIKILRFIFYYNIL